MDLADGLADCRVEAEVGGVGQVALAELLAIEDHAEVGAKPGFGDLSGVVESGGFDLLAGDDVGKDVGEVALHGAKVGGGRVGEDELLNVFGMGGGVGDGEEASIGVADEVDCGKMKVGADGFKIGDLGVHRLGSVGGDTGGSAHAALVIEDDLAGAGEAFLPNSSTSKKARHPATCQASLRQAGLHRRPRRSPVYNLLN